MLYFHFLFLLKSDCLMVFNFVCYFQVYNLFFFRRYDQIQCIVLPGDPVHMLCEVLSASNCISLLPGAGVGLCSVQSMFGRLKSPMMTCCDSKISSSIVQNSSSSAAVILVFVHISTSLRCTEFLRLMSTLIISLVQVADDFLSIV